MALTLAHVALIDILTDRLITYTNMVRRVKDMDEEEAMTEIEKVDTARAEEVKRLLSH